MSCGDCQLRLSHVRLTTYTRNDERQTQVFVVVLDRRIECGGKRICEELRQIWVPQTYRHVVDHLLRRSTVSIANKLTSTAGLLNVRHSGWGRMEGSFNGPEENGVCASMAYLV
jgi:hypothetical protein